MRVDNLSRARIARAVSVTLLLSLLQVVIVPVLAPQLTTPLATAADANDLPSGLGTVYQFLAESYTSGSTTWPEARGGSGATISSSAIKVTNTAGTLGASKSVVAVQGSYLTSITFPSTIAYGNATNPNNYTFFHVARYAPQQSGLTSANYCDTIGDGITNNAGKKNRIFSSSANNWLSGFWACAAGVSYHYGWLTQFNDPVSELAGNNGNNWLLSADCGYVSTSTSTCNGRYRAFGTDRTTNPSTSVVGHSVVVNGGQFPAEVSDFQIAEVISYPTILSVTDIVKVETYLARKYGITLSASSATKLGVHRASVGTSLNEPLAIQPQIAIQDANGQTVTTNNSTIITATVTGLNGRVIGTATADAVQGVATFDGLGIDGIPGNSYTITYSSNGGHSNTSETRTFTRGGSSETDTALMLNGTNQYAERTESGATPFDLTGDVTLQAWVYPTTDCAGDQAIVAKLNSYMMYCGGGLWKYVFDADGLAWAGSNSTIKVIKNEWHHIAFAKSGTTMSIYMDGNIVQTVTGLTASMSPNNDAFQIGRYGTSSYFQGKIDEVRVYNSSRSQSQIQADMHNYGSISDSNLIAYYDFNEGSGTTLYNRDVGTSSVSDLTVYGSPTWADVKVVDTTTLSAYTILKFERSYLTSGGGWKVPSGVSKVTALIVGGGGGGGGAYTADLNSGGGGGGGGGAFATPTPLNISGITNISVVVGAGGVGGPASSTREGGTGNKGQTSYFGSLSAGGGGAGGYVTTTNANGLDGTTAGGGGGASNYLNAYNSGAGGTSIPTNFGGQTWQGYDGGSGAVFVAGVSAGGDAAPGGGATLSASRTSVGGGLSVSITGATVSYGRGGSARGVTGWSFASVGPNLGTGGSGQFGASAAGGNGSSGFVVVRWITASKPVFTQPSIDTTTAGLIDTITVSANPLNPLTRSYQWQVSTDTGTTWSNASQGSGTNTAIYTTPVLETATSGIRYQYRVVITDSDSLGLSIMDTSTSVYIVVNARITYTGSYTVQKYGSTHQDTFTATNGTGNKTFAYSPNNRSGITWSSPIANTAVLTIGTTLPVGTYLETITATDTKGAQTLLGLSIVVSKADTITVTAISRSETFTGSTLTFTPTFTVSGLKNTDTVTAAAMNWNYNGLENSGTLYSIQSTRPTNAGSYIITPVTPASLTDSYTAVTVVPATLAVTRATRTLSITPPGSPIKFGDTRTVTATPSAGSGDGSITFATTTTDSCTVSSSTVTAVRSSGTCSFTATISRGNNYETATSIAGTSTLAKADTLTVAVNAMTALTYTGAQIGITPSVTVSGLKLTNSVGATPATIRYASNGVTGACASGGTCSLGDTGPGGGTVFYDAGSQQSWGRYLEIAKSGWSGSAGDATAQWCSAGLSNTVSNVRSTGVGFGLSNSTTLASFCGAGAAFNSRAYNGGGKTNWFLPTQSEFQLAFNNRNYLDLDPIGIYWLSHEANNGDASWVGNSWVMSSQGAGGNNKSDVTAYRPVRAFAAGDTGQNFDLTKPTDADTYTVRASGLSLSSGSLNDYQGITYVDATLRVNRALQSQLMLAEYGATFGTPYRIIVFGGSGTGASSVTTTSGTATGCSISGETLTTSTVGTCSVTAVKAQDKNYETATVTISVYFLQFVVQQPSPVTVPGPGIALSGATSVTLDPNQAPTISGISISSGRAGDTVTITGSGFTASALQSVKFWRNILAAVQGTPTNTQIVILVPAGATTGKIIVITANGSAITEGSFTVLP